MSTSEASYPTKGGHTAHTETHDESTIAWCTSNCGSTRTYWGHLSADPAADANDWAETHAARCTVTTTGGRPVADDYQAAEPPDYNLGHAITGWAEATRGQALDSTGELRWATTTGSATVTLGADQASHLTRVLNVDAGIHLAHAAATRKD